MVPVATEGFTDIFEVWIIKKGFFYREVGFGPCTLNGFERLLSASDVNEACGSLIVYFDTCPFFKKLILFGIFEVILLELKIPLGF